MYKIGIVGHRTNIKRIESIINEADLPVIITPIVFEDVGLKDITIQYMRSNDDDMQAILYTGQVPFDLIHQQLDAPYPSLYLEHDNNTLERALLKASLLDSTIITNLTIDSYNREDILSAFTDLNIDQSHMHLYVNDIDLLGEHMVMDLVNFHHHNVRNRGTSFCITGISAVHEQLVKLKIPSILLQPSKNTIISLIQQLMHQIDSLSNKDSQIVVLGIEIDMPSEYNLIYDNEYHLMREKTRVTEEVYRFAEKIQAAVVETGMHNYLLFSTRKSLEDATDTLTAFPLLEAVMKGSSHTISVGIGFGSTGMEAKKNSAKALNKALKSNGNKAYIFEDGDYSEPILPPMEDVIGSSTIGDSIYQTISNETGVSTNTIFELHCIKEQWNKELFTSKELSKAFDISSRSMNRVLKKLEAGGYVTVDSTRMMTDSGRPTRILKLNF